MHAPIVLCLSLGPESWLPLLLLVVNAVIVGSVLELCSYRCDKRGDSIRFITQFIMLSIHFPCGGEGFIFPRELLLSIDVHSGTVPLPAIFIWSHSNENIQLSLPRMMTHRDRSERDRGRER